MTARAEVIRMGRREFMTLLGGAAVAWPLGAGAQQSRKIPRIGVLWHASNEDEEAIYLGALRQGFSELGYVEGKTIMLENRFAGEQYDRFERLATDLVESRVDVLVAVTRPAAAAAGSSFVHPSLLLDFAGVAVLVSNRLRERGEAFCWPSTLLSR